MLLIPVLLSLLLAAEQHPETLAGVTNFMRIDATIACAGATTPGALAELRKLGFTSIVNFRREEEPEAEIPASKAAAAAAGLKYFHIPVDSANPSAEAADEFLRIVSNPDNQPLFIHCRSGARAAAMWLIKRVVVDRWDMDRAIKESETLGLTHAGLKQFAIDYATAHKDK